MIGTSAIFLDRDGTIIVDKHYLCDPAGVELEQGAVAGLKALANMGYALVVVSNQSGIARGRFTAQDAIAVNARVAELLAEEGISILDWYFCPHVAEDDCSCRKPRPGMIDRAAHEHGLDPSHSFVVGDKLSDLELADAVGATGFLVETGEGAEHASWAKQHGYDVCRDLADFAQSFKVTR